MTAQATIEVEVSLYSTFRKGRFEKAGMKLPEASKVSDLVSMLGIPAADLGVLLVNGRDGTMDLSLRPGDRITLIPGIGGG